MGAPLARRVDLESPPSVTLTRLCFHRICARREHARVVSALSADPLFDIRAPRAAPVGAIGHQSLEAVSILGSRVVYEHSGAVANTPEGHYALAVQSDSM